jgi:hypothetical protein
MLTDEHLVRIVRTLAKMPQSVYSAFLSGLYRHDLHAVIEQVGPQHLDTSPDLEPAIRTPPELSL